MPRTDRPSEGDLSTTRRALLLGACTAGGVAMGAAGWWFSGDTRWMLALPAVIALGWLFVADPSRCDQPHGRRKD